MRLDDTKDMVVQALVAQITVDGIIGLDCLRLHMNKRLADMIPYVMISTDQSVLRLPVLKPSIR